MKLRLQTAQTYEIIRLILVIVYLRFILSLYSMTNAFKKDLYF